MYTYRLKVNNWYTLGYFHKAKQLLDNDCHPLEEEIHYEAMGLK